jgi:hypothetical protein
MDHQPLTIAGLYQELVVQFLADLMTATNDVPTPEAFQHAAQAFCDALAPWLDPADGPARPRAVFPILEDCKFDDEAERVSVRFSPEGEALFRAWVRRQAVLLHGGFYTAADTSH